MSDSPTPFSDFETHLDGRLALAVAMAREAGDLTRDKYFQTDRFVVERKKDNSPVTTADKEAEQCIRARVGKSFSQDGILGEEFGTEAGQSGYDWVVDPIDGTKSFLSGVPLYSTLVGVTHQGKSLAGVIYIPALQEIIFAAIGKGAWYQRPGRPWSRVSVSKVANLKDGLFVTSQVDNFDKRGASLGYQNLQSTAYITRTWGDGYGYLLVATGRAEVMVDPIVSPWDIAAIQPIMLEAGGKCTAWNGEFSIHAGDCIGSNGLVHDEVLSLLKSGK